MLVTPRYPGQRDAAVDLSLCHDWYGASHPGPASCLASSIG
ncbi:hypothetical protein [Streptomyces sulphureus]|nr:hypothetical protein [Streptomyces sulphureus]